MKEIISLGNILPHLSFPFLLSIFCTMQFYINDHITSITEKQNTETPFYLNSIEILSLLLCGLPASCSYCQTRFKYQTKPIANKKKSFFIAFS